MPVGFSERRDSDLWFFKKKEVASCPFPGDGEDRGGADKFCWETPGRDFIFLNGEARKLRWEVSPSSLFQVDEAQAVRTDFLGDLHRGYHRTGTDEVGRIWLFTKRCKEKNENSRVKEVIDMTSKEAFELDDLLKSYWNQKPEIHAAFGTFPIAETP